MALNGAGEDSTDRTGQDAFRRHVAASFAPPPSAALSPGFTSNLAALTGSQGYPSVDHGAALMMTNAAAAIAAVAASAVQQMNQSNVAAQSAVGASAASLPSALYAALQSNRHPLIPGASAPPQVNPSHHHAALLAAVANAGGVKVPSITGSVSGHDAAAALMRPSTASVLSHTPSALTSSSLLSNLQSWTKEQIEQHVALLHQMNQPVPQSVALLLSESQRKDKKKNAKRVANRKSASTSRARKKALVEEMTKANARLKRQAMILALLPDLVITTNTDGDITFCSAQVERILHYKAEGLLGAKLYNLLVPASQDALKALVDELVNPGKAQALRAAAAAQSRRSKKRRNADARNSHDAGASRKKTEENTTGNGSSSARNSSRTGVGSSGDTSGDAVVVSEQSFPMSVVEVESKQQTEQQKLGASNGSNENLSASNSGDDGGATATQHMNEKSNKRTRSDDSSSLSSETKNLRANDNLDRNVRWHNQRMLEESKKHKSIDGPKDDVTGASVTANNASARLSSLQHVPERSHQKKDDKSSRDESTGDQSSSDDSLLAGVEEKKKGESASDDSGYRESNESREEMSSSGSDTSRSNDRRKKPLAPTFRMCLIRNDLTTVWCEVTSSIRTRTSEEEDGEEKTLNSKSSGSISDAQGSNEGQLELLLCLRPIREGDKIVDESLRFVPPAKVCSSPKPSGFAEAFVSSSSGDNNQDEKGDSDRTLSEKHTNKPGAVLSQEYAKRPPKKRSLAVGMEVLSSDDGNPPDKRAKTDGSGRSDQASNETEKSVVESLMLMNKFSQ